jgi:predicted ABC-class ATPase
VTLIVGGAFHGKSTLLDAVARAVHPHHSGDGRERVATLPEAVTVRAEDGRSVREVDISAFLGDLPSGAVARSFTTDKASGSTSQAAAIVEALEVGAKLLLLDEDRCATNFMIRDGRMQRLVRKQDEPITPFLDRVRELYDRFGLSTILVTGGSGDYLEVAHTVIRMKDYRALDATVDAREVTVFIVRVHRREVCTVPFGRKEPGRLHAERSEDPSLEEPVERLSGGDLDDAGEDVRRPAVAPALAWLLVEGSGQDAIHAVFE